MSQVLLKSEMLEFDLITKVNYLNLAQTRIKPTDNI